MKNNENILISVVGSICRIRFPSSYYIIKVYR